MTIVTRLSLKRRAQKHSSSVVSLRAALRHTEGAAPINCRAGGAAARARRARVGRPHRLSCGGCCRSRSAWRARAGPANTATGAARHVFTCKKCFCFRILINSIMSAVVVVLVPSAVVVPLLSSNACIRSIDTDGCGG